jgi:hypothetical protein
MAITLPRVQKHSRLLSTSTSRLHHHLLLITQPTVIVPIQMSFVYCSLLKRLCVDVYRMLGPISSAILTFTTSSTTMCKVTFTHIPGLS